MYYITECCLKKIRLKCLEVIDLPRKSAISEMMVALWPAWDLQVSY